MSGPRFSANTGFLWREKPFLERIELAAGIGFDAVEFHDEAQRQDIGEVKDKLAKCRLPLVSLNTNMHGIFGLGAIPGREQEAREDIDAALEAAEILSASAIHVLAGCTNDIAARATFVQNLRYALDNTDKTILIEPIARAVVPGYFLSDFNQVAAILDEVSNPRLKILFDCFHARHETGDPAGILHENLKQIGHVQISSFPGRNEPFDGELSYSRLIPDLIAAGYDGFFGCEYIPATSVEAGINWWETFGK